MRQITQIIIHCTATPEGREHNASDVDRWHKEKGWKGIGYHWLIKLDGTIEQGRPEAEAGAHCFLNNSNSIGIVYVGGLDKQMKSKDTRTPEQKISLLHLLNALKARYPKAIIYGHRDLEPSKDCPSFDAKTEYQYF